VIPDKPTDAQLVALLEALGYVQSTSAKGVWFLPNGSGTFTRLHRLRTWEGVGLVQAAMAGLGWRFWVRSYVMSYGAAFYRPEGDETEFAVEGDTAPDAIVLAACAALGVPG